MVITCPKCVEGVADGTTCVYCGGDGEIDLLDAKFKELTGGESRALTGKIWTDMLAKLDAIIAEQASLREDLTAALLQIWNKVKTL